MSDELSKLVIADLSNLKKVFETFVEEKEKHRNYYRNHILFEAKEADRLKHLTPIVKYQNPDTWIRQVSIFRLFLVLYVIFMIFLRIF